MNNLLLTRMQLLKKNSHMNMKKITALIVSASLVLAASFAYAKEPANLAIAKAAVIKYHDSGEYLQDISAVIQQAKNKLETELQQHAADKKKKAIVLDIDETALSNYVSMLRLNFGGTLEEITQDEDKGKDPGIKPTLALFQYAKAHGIAVFFITGRQESERAVTIDNLNKAGYSNWDGLVLRSADYKKAPAAVYKTAMRKQLVDQGYDIMMNIGDQDSDLRGGFADHGYKLPNPYYLIP